MKRPVQSIYIPVYAIVGRISDNYSSVHGHGSFKIFKKSTFSIVCQKE